MSYDAAWASSNSSTFHPPSMFDLTLVWSLHLRGVSSYPDTVHILQVLLCLMRWFSIELGIQACQNVHYQC